MFKINEIFYSVQGEGYYTGRPAVFVRFSGCNLKCPFCDTQHQTGQEMSTEQLLRVVTAYPCRFMVLTGGEPSLFVTPELIDQLHAAGFYVAMETNGTHPVTPNVDWVTCSPKDQFCGAAAALVSQRIDEIKVIYDGQCDVLRYASIPAQQYYVQPCDTGDAQRNAALLHQVLDFCLQHPQWRISLQTHKILNVR